MNILLTGATGFIGKALVTRLIELNYAVTALVRVKSSTLAKEVKQINGIDFGELSENGSSTLSKYEVKKNLKDVSVVIHMAARVHVMQDDSAAPLAEFRAVNRDATLALATMAAEAGVKRFVFISSVKVNGEITEFNKPFTTDDKFVPDEYYGLSKYEAEQGLLALAKDTGMEVVIIRPPLVYGPGVRANFESMMKWINKQVPLPFGAIHNQRSLIALDNLTSFITHCIDHSKAANQVFLVSDGQDVSTTELLQKVAQALDKKIWLIPLPVNLMAFTAKLIGKGVVADRLFSSLQIDGSKARDLLGWKPIITMDEQLKKTADVYLGK